MPDAHTSWEVFLDKWFVRLLIPAILINASGLFIHIIEPDGALYATISRTIAETGDFIHLRVEVMRGRRCLSAQRQGSSTFQSWTLP